MAINSNHIEKEGVVISPFQGNGAPDKRLSGELSEARLNIASLFNISNRVNHLRQLAEAISEEPHHLSTLSEIYDRSEQAADTQFPDDEAVATQLLLEIFAQEFGRYVAEAMITNPKSPFVVEQQLFNKFPNAKKGYLSSLKGMIANESGELDEEQQLGAELARTARKMFGQVQLTIFLNVLKKKYGEARLDHPLYLAIKEEALSTRFSFSTEELEALAAAQETNHDINLPEEKPERALVGQLSSESFQPPNNPGLSEENEGSMADYEGIEARGDSAVMPEKKQRIAWPQTRFSEDVLSHEKFLAGIEQVLQSSAAIAHQYTHLRWQADIDAQAKIVAEKLAGNPSLASQNLSAPESYFKAARDAVFFDQDGPFNLFSTFADKSLSEDFLAEYQEALFYILTPVMSSTVMTPERYVASVIVKNALNCITEVCKWLLLLHEFKVSSTADFAIPGWEEHSWTYSDNTFLMTVGGMIDIASSVKRKVKYAGREIKGKRFYKKWSRQKSYNLKRAEVFEDPGYLSLMLQASWIERAEQPA